MIRYSSKSEGRVAVLPTAASSSSSQPLLLATINCHASTTSSSSSSFENETVRSNRQEGPVLLEVMELRWWNRGSPLAAEGGYTSDEGDRDDLRSAPKIAGGSSRSVSAPSPFPSCWTTRSVCRSRSNPSLGTSLASTCLDVGPLSSLSALSLFSEAAASTTNHRSYRGFLPLPVVTGLSTGALCLHTFAPDTNTSTPTSSTFGRRHEKHQHNDKNRSPNDDDSDEADEEEEVNGGGCGGWIPKLTFYQHASRGNTQHRPATSVAWRRTPNENDEDIGVGSGLQQHHPSSVVAVGLVAPGSIGSAYYHHSSVEAPLAPAKSGTAALASAATTTVPSTTHRFDRDNNEVSRENEHKGWRGDGSTEDTAASTAAPGPSWDRRSRAPTQPQRAATAASSLASSSSRAGSAGGGFGMGGTSTATAATTASISDRDYCCLLWDLEHQSSSTAASSSSRPSAGATATARRSTHSTPLHMLSHQMGVASLAWLMDGNLLACGGQQRSLQVFDVRSGLGGGGALSPPMSVSLAHGSGSVHVVRPHRGSDPWLLASFCKSPGEPVRVWDCRRIDAASGPVAEIRPSSFDGTSSFVSAVQWSRFDSGRLVVAAGGAVHEYDLLSSSSSSSSSSSAATGATSLRPIPVQTFYLNERVADFCLLPSEKRLVAVPGGANSTIFDLALHTSSPVAVSRRDGRVVNAFRRSLWIGSPQLGPAAMEKEARHLHTTFTDPSSARTVNFEAQQSCDKEIELTPDDALDVSATMMRRAKCRHVVRYGMDPTSNIKVLLQERESQTCITEPSVPIHGDLLNVWSWVERVDELCGESDDPSGGSSALFWPARSLADAGAARFVLSSEHEPDEQVFSETLGCVTHESSGRHAARTACGWSGRYDLVNVMADCEAFADYERSAALAAWEGDVGASIDALDRGASFIRSQLSGAGRARTAQNALTAEFADLLERVSLCVAGFRPDDVGSPAASVWRRSCSSLMHRVNEETKHHQPGSLSPRIAYLRALLRFLVSLGADTGNREVLCDKSLSLGDRVAFACRFLPRADLVQFLAASIAECQSTGNLEGLIVTGLDREGIKILQTFVDRTADVQTAALITSRVILPPDWTFERTVCQEWLDSYRSLLNTWQMWQSRAMLDVDRADVLRKFKARLAGIASAAAGATPAQGIPVSLPQVSIPSRTQLPSVGYSTRHSARSGTVGAGTSFGRTKSSGPAGGGGGSTRHLEDPDVMAAIPAQLDARCNYCSAPLGLRSQDTTRSSQLLSKMRPVLSCCPQCRKPLPRCAICLLPLGTPNPYMELLAAKDGGGSGSGGRQTSGGSTTSKGLSSSPTMIPGSAGAVPPSSSTSTGGTGSSSSVADLSSLASLPFAEWFTWCLRCRHGGHAHHWLGWFAKHDVCPVSGCDCRCQFDGIRAMNRGGIGVAVAASGSSGLSLSSSLSRPPSRLEERATTDPVDGHNN